MRIVTATSGIVSYNASKAVLRYIINGKTRIYCATMPKDYLGSDQRKVKDDPEKEDKPIQCE